MLKVALILGIVGGILGLLLGILAGTVGFFASLLTGYELFAVGGILLFGFSIIGIIGGVLAMEKPVLAGVFMLAGGIGGFFILFIFWTFASIFLLIGGVLAIASRKEKMRSNV